MYIYILVLISYILVTIFKSKKTLHMFQQNLYNRNNRYIKWLIKNKKTFIDLDVFNVILAIIGIIFMENPIILNLTSILIIINNIILSVLWKNRVKNEQKKLPLKITNRVKRLIVTLIIIYIIPNIILIFNNNIIQINNMVLALFVYLNPIVLMVINIINKPIEKSIYIYYLTTAKRKLVSRKDIKVIGITGSYGKTSSKNILRDILSIKYNVLATPKNLNTPYGMIITINQHLSKFDNIFIAEMGAYKKGEIKELCDIVKPSYGILTNIGTAHLESFGSQENIIEGKFELIESLPNEGFAVLNGDDKNQMNHKIQNNVRRVTIGIYSEGLDIQAFNIKSNNKGTSFDIKLKNKKEIYSFQTKLLGEHNVYNILAGIAFGIEFGIEFEDLVKAVKKVKPIEHRLELKRIGNFYQIDDAYNSNLVGATNAVKVLDTMPGVKIVVTPGMVELGEKEEEYNKIFGEKIAEVADYVILIGENKTRPIREGLVSKKFEESKIITYNDVKQAYNFISTLQTEKDKYALFENDLPDIYNE